MFAFSPCKSTLKSIIDIASYAGSVDVEGNRIGESLVKAIGSDAAQCEYIGGLGEVCTTPVIGGLSYVVKEDAACPYQDWPSGTVTLPTCATVGGFALRSLD